MLIWIYFYVCLSSLQINNISRAHFIFYSDLPGYIFLDTLLCLFAFLPIGKIGQPPFISLFRPRSSTKQNQKKRFLCQVQVHWPIHLSCYKFNYKIWFSVQESLHSQRYHKCISIRATLVRQIVSI